MALLGELTLLEGRIIMHKNPSEVDEHGLSHTISYAGDGGIMRISVAINLPEHSERAEHDGPA